MTIRQMSVVEAKAKLSRKLLDDGPVDLTHHGYVFARIMPMKMVGTLVIPVTDEEPVDFPVPPSEMHDDDKIGGDYVVPPGVKITHREIPISDEQRRIAAVVPTAIVLRPDPPPGVQRGVSGITPAPKPGRSKK